MLFGTRSLGTSLSVTFDQLNTLTHTLAGHLYFKNIDNTYSAAKIIRNKMLVFKCGIFKIVYEVHTTISVFLDTKINRVLLRKYKYKMLFNTIQSIFYHKRNVLRFTFYIICLDYDEYVIFVEYHLMTHFDKSTNNIVIFIRKENSAYKECRYYSWRLEKNFFQQHLPSQQQQQKEQQW